LKGIGEVFLSVLFQKITAHSVVEYLYHIVPDRGYALKLLDLYFDHVYVASICELDWNSSRYSSVTSFCEHNNEPLDSIETGSLFTMWVTVKSGIGCLQSVYLSVEPLWDSWPDFGCSQDSCSFVCHGVSSLKRGWVCHIIGHSSYLCQVIYT